MVDEAALEGCGRGAEAVALRGPRFARAPQGDGHFQGVIHGAAGGKARQQGHRDQGRGLQLGRPARPRKRTHRGRAHGARHRARLCAGEAVSARAQGLSRRELRSGRDPRNGRARAAWPDHPGGIWRRRPRLCGLRPDRARDRARRFRLPLGHVGAVLARDAPDLCLWQRSAAAQISAQARDRRDGRLLRARPSPTTAPTPAR